MLTKWIRGVIFVLVVLITLAALLYAVMNWYGKSAWLKHRKAQEAAGVNYDLASVAPPPIPDAQNMAATPIFRDLFETNQPPIANSLRGRRAPSCPEAEGNWLLARAGDRAAWADCMTNSLWIESFTNANLNAILAAWMPILADVEKTADYPACRFPIRYEDGFACLLPHISAFLHISRIYRIQAMQALDAGQSDAALRGIHTTLRLARMTENDPMLISILLRVAMMNIAIQPVWEGLAEHRWNEAQLLQLQNAFESISLNDHLRRSLHVERLCGMQAMDQLSANHSQFFQFFSLFEDETEPSRRHRWLARAIPAGWLYLNQLNLDREYIRMTEWLQKSATGPVKPSSLDLFAESRERRRPNLFYLFSQVLLPTFEGCVLRTVRAECSAKQVAAACALERWFLESGSYPERLDDLVPSLLSERPLDVMDKQPLRYRRDAPDRFVLYSIGWNRKDDGGQIATTKGDRPNADEREGDWVWQSQPEQGPQP